MHKEIKFNNEAREKILNGVNILADAVVSTLGPRGQNVIFEESSYPTITKDGVTVAQQIFLEDKFENMGAMVAREAAENTNREAGDGTTSTIALLRSIFTEGHKAVAAGMNPILLKRGMDHELARINNELSKIAKKITTDEEKEQVATISANNDAVTGKLIADVIKEVGTNGVVTVSSSNSLETEVEYVKGAKLSSGYESHLFITDHRKLAAEIDNPEIILCTDQITMTSQLVPLIQDLITNGKKKMVLIADRIEGPALTFLVQNHLQGKFTCLPITLTSFGDFNRDIFYDIAALTNATVLGENETTRIEDAKAHDTGNIQKIITNRFETILFGAEGNVKKRIEEVESLLKEHKDTFLKEKLKSRLGRLTGSIANIMVGGASESEQTEVRYRIEDALNATKSAIEEGIVEGGGMTLLRIGSHKKVDKGNKEFEAGQLLVRDALKEPLKRIVDNGGISGEAVIGHCLDYDIGYNALTEKYEDLFAAGIIDPKKVVRNAITNAVSTAGILLTSGCAITIKPKKND